MHLLADLHRASFPADHVISRDESQTITWSMFLSDMDHMRRVFGDQGHQAYALYEADTYRFSVALLALLAEGRRVFLPGENHAAIVQALREHEAWLVGEFGAAEAQAIETGVAAGSVLGEFNLSGEIVVFTSGSTGEPKAIPKRLRQIDAELAVLEQRFSEALGVSTVLGTVSHQHLYGLLFHLFWPLCAGRVFWRRPFVDPLLLARQALQCPATCWVMSPGHLHRLGPDMPWAELRGVVRNVFSSGGPLQWSAARQLAVGLGYCPTEVLGSSETGGIASRRQETEGEPWEPLPEVECALSEEGTLKVRSDFLKDDQWYVTQDKIDVVDGGRFVLLGRADRIVKLEGKRISLTEVEQALCAHAWVNQAHAQQVQRQRALVGALLVLSPAGVQAVQSLGLALFKRDLRKALADSLAALAVPRVLRLVARLPRNSQGKLLPEAVAERFANNTSPPELSLQDGESSCTLALWVDKSCPYFEGHFPAGPVLPGVVQINWAEGLASQYLTTGKRFGGMQTVKFKEMIRPDTLVQLELTYNAERDQLQFRFASASGEHSQGRLLYTEGP